MKSLIIVIISILTFNLHAAYICKLLTQQVNENKEVIKTLKIETFYDKVGGPGIFNRELDKIKVNGKEYYRTISVYALGDEFTSYSGRLRFSFMDMDAGIEGLEGVGTFADFDEIDSKKIHYKGVMTSISCTTADNDYIDLLEKEKSIVNLEDVDQANDTLVVNDCLRLKNSFFLPKRDRCLKKLGY